VATDGTGKKFCWVKLARSLGKKVFPEKKSFLTGVGLGSVEFKGGGGYLNKSKLRFAGWVFKEGGRE